MPNTRKAHYESPELPQKKKLKRTSKIDRTVANVNKQIKLRKTDAKNEQLTKIRSGTPMKSTRTGKGSLEKGKQAFAKRCKQIAKQANAEKLDSMPGPSSDRSFRNEPEAEPASDYSDEDTAEFIEGDQLIRMTVDKDDSFYETESEDGSESSDDTDVEASDQEVRSTQQNVSPRGLRKLKYNTIKIN